MLAKLVWSSGAEKKILCILLFSERKEEQVLGALSHSHSRTRTLAVALTRTSRNLNPPSSTTLSNPSTPLTPLHCNLSSLSLPSPPKSSSLRLLSPASR